MDSYSNIVSLVNQAGTALSSRDYRGALETYSQAFEIAKASGRTRLMAVLLNRMGQTLQEQGKIQDAVIAYESALRALENEIDLNLDFVTRQLSQVSKGYVITEPEPIPDLYNANVAGELEAEEQDTTLVVRLWLNIGNAYLHQPQEAPALNAYQQALQRPEIETNPLLKAYTLANIGEIYRRQDQIDQAATNLSQALQLFDQYPNPLEKRRALALLASIARDRDEMEKAIELYQQAISLYEQAGDRFGAGRTYAGLANLYLRQERIVEAQQTYQKAIEYAESENDQDTLWHSYWGLGCCQSEIGKLQGAIDSFEQSLRLIEVRQQELRTDEGKVAFLENVQEVFERLLNVHLQLAKTGEQEYRPALEVAERARGRALQDLMQDRERQHPQLIDPKAIPPESNEFDGLPVAQNPGNMAMQMAMGVSVMPFDPTIQAAPTASSTHFINTDDSIAAAELHPDVPPLARLVFYCLTDRTAIFAVTPDGEVQGHVVPIGDDAIADRVVRLRRALQVDEVSRGMEWRKLVAVDQVEPADFPVFKVETLLKELYQNFVAPVADYLPRDSTPVVIEPHCSLWLVPFAALLLPDETWMGDRWSLIYAPSAQTLEEIRQEPCYAPLNQAKLLAVGNPIMPKVHLQDGIEIQLSPLPGAEVEVEAIAQLFPESQRTLLIQHEATEAKVKALALNHNIVHLATHGIAYGSDPLASLVAFSPIGQEDGLLTAREVIRSAALPADLVVLSACQTGLGRITGEGMLGLSRAFLVAGARSVIVSQWSVSDSATKELMVAFYKHYLDSGNKAAALQEAMQKVRSQPKYNHPRYWASFILVGAEL